jgi:putative ABC transport system ATP-binding protein
MDLMVQLNREQGLTFVLVTHDRGVGERCDRIVRMRDGHIVDDRTTAAGGQER